MVVHLLEHGVCRRRSRVGMVTGTAAVQVVGIVVVVAVVRVGQRVELPHIFLRRHSLQVVMRELLLLLLLLSMRLLHTHRLQMRCLQTLRQLLMLSTSQMWWRALRWIRVKMALKPRRRLLLLVDLQGMGHCRAP
jgi:hypothetical protein